MSYLIILQTGEDKYAEDTFEDTFTDRGTKN